MEENCSSTLASSGPPGPLALLAAADATSWLDGLAPLVLCILLVLAVSFLAAMVEAAFLALSAARAHAMEDSADPLARMAARLRLDFGKPLATVVVVNNATNIAGSALTAIVAADYFGRQGAAVGSAMGVFTGILTLVIIIVGEVVPKTIGENHCGAVARWAAYPVYWLKGLLAPVLWIIGLAQRPFVRVGVRRTSADEIAHLATIGQEQGAIEEREEDMIHRVLQLDEITAEDIMTPRIEMVSLPADRLLRDVAEDLGRITRTRVPLCRKNRDDVVAILDRMDALLALARDKGELPLTDPSLSTKPYFVPKTMPADQLLVKLRRRTNHIAIVVGEYGETAGLVTLEDVVEEIVGEIYDEADIGVGDGIQAVNEGELLVLGAAEVKDVNERLGTEIPNHRTVAGLLLDELERIPQKGEVHEAHGVRFVVEDANERAILKVRIARKTAAPAAETAEAAERTGS